MPFNVLREGVSQERLCHNSLLHFEEHCELVSSAREEVVSRKGIGLFEIERYTVGCNGYQSLIRWF